MELWLKCDRSVKQWESIGNAMKWNGFYSRKEELIWWILSGRMHIFGRTFIKLWKIWDDEGLMECIAAYGSHAGSCSVCGSFERYFALQKWLSLGVVIGQLYVESVRSLNWCVYNMLFGSLVVYVYGQIMGVLIWELTLILATIIPLTQRPSKFITNDNPTAYAIATVLRAAEGRYRSETEIS